MDELLRIEAHDSEILCLAFSPAETGKLSFSLQQHSIEFNYAADQAYFLVEKVKLI